MPGPYFVSDKCQEDKCLDPLLVRTNARRTNARTHIIFGQMPGGQMPEPTFGPDKCQEDKCLNPQVQAFVHRGICPLLAFVLRGICPTGGQMPVQAFVLPGICLSRHLSANRLNNVKKNYWYLMASLRQMGLKPLSLDPDPLWLDLDPLSIRMLVFSAFAICNSNK